MKERPTIFKAEMVRAILTCASCGKISISFPCEHCGSENFIKTQTRRIVKPQPMIMPLGGGCWYPDSESKHRKHYGTTAHFLRGMPLDFCPFGIPGDRLWVRECFRIGDQGSVFYKADEPWNKCPDWRSSIHMPRWASRITLEITDVRVQRVQEISEEDIKAEGTRIVPVGEDSEGYDIVLPMKMYFEDLWNSIHGPDAWECNDWVWAISFRRLP